jgi:hypothetical protein
MREREFEVGSAPVEVIEGEEEIKRDEVIEIIPNKKVRKLKAKRIEPTLVLEEAEEAIEIPNEVQEAEEEEKLEEIIFPEEKLEITPVKKRKSRKQREQKLRVNPPGKKGTRRNIKLPENIDIQGDLEVV